MRNFNNLAKLGLFCRNSERNSFLLRLNKISLQRFLDVSFAEATSLQMIIVIIKEHCLYVRLSVTDKRGIVKNFLWGESGGRVLNQLFVWRTTVSNHEVRKAQEGQKYWPVGLACLRKVGQGHYFRK